MCAMPVVTERPRAAHRGRLWISSYAADPPRPAVGSRWVWEPRKEHARENLEVVEVKWNGEEWWVKTRSLPTQAKPVMGLLGPIYVSRQQRAGDEHWNDLSRFWEAVRPLTQGS